MQSANRLTGRALRAGLLALAAGAAVTPALAGGPLFVVPSGGTLKPARWQGVVNVYTDLGDLGATPNATVTKVVEDALAQWSSVPNSTFRAKLAGQLPYDVTGANADQVIGSFPGGGNPSNSNTSNGGGIHVVYDGDDSVIADFMGAGYGVLGIASPEYLAARRLDADRRGLGHHRRAVAQRPVGRGHFRRRHARVRARHQPRALTDERLLRG